ncbi:redoxin domain-containing protein [Daejeonella sp.]|uniref:redoxin domain-containing protein n=1 Tax=Daejeonella sp. TaxID=2805397 RepID=UPI0025B7FED7|nr:redoxin domain-containing protein [Daejeonella sp.]
MQDNKRFRTMGLRHFIYCLFFVAIIDSVQAQSKFIKTPPQLANIKRLQAMVEANPENLKAHQTFLNALAPEDPYLKIQYAIWLKRFPKSFNVPFSIGKSLTNRLYPEGRAFLLKAVELNPKHAESWFLLGIDAANYGDTLAQQKYMAKAKEAEPENSKYAFQYAYSFKDTNPATFDSLSIAVAFKFPDSEEAPLALTYLALNSKNPNEKIAFFEQLYKRYSAKPYPSSSYGIQAFFNLLLEKNPQRAFEVALNMVIEPKVNHYEWSKNLNLVRTYRDAKNMMDLNNPSKALEVLDGLSAENRKNDRYVLFKTEIIEAIYDSEAAYDTLSLFYAKRPGIKSRFALLAYAKKFGKDEEQVDLDIRSLREAAAPIAKDFYLQRYTDTNRVSLSDYKGKIILLTYWFPTCPPCLAEFPHLESVVKKYTNRELVYLGINTERKQDAYVLPFLRSKRYSFLPLKEEPRDKGNLHYWGVPQNYLIDQKGRVMFSDFRIDESNEDMLDLMIKELLE